jgi:hypothetical protein
MNEYIDLYCERLYPGLWSEPLNAISNVSFVIAAWAMWRLSKNHKKISPEIWVLIILTMTIGIGSFLFHAFATKWALVTDLLPILLFQVWFIWLYNQKIIGIKTWQNGITIALFVIAVILSGQFIEIANGSLGYAPAILVLIGLGIYHYRSKKQEPMILLTATIVFLLSLSCRTFDQVICSFFPIGTHFLWHLFNGILLYLSARGLILNYSTIFTKGV